MKRKLWNITVKDNPNRAAMVMGDNDEFYTTDTEAYLVFKLEDKNFNPATAVLTLENRNDGSLKNETVDVVDGLIEWEMPQRYIEHFGNWQGQLVYEDTKDGQPELYTSAPFSFVVNAHIGDKKKPSLVEIENWEKFIREGTELIETWEDMEDLRQANEAQRQENYQELLDTGVLQTNINTKLEALEEEYAPKLTEVTAQLAQKAQRAEVYLKSVGLSLDDFSEEDRAVILGMEPGEINAVLGKGNVKPENTSFLKNKPNSKNLFNPNDPNYVIDKSLSGSDGSLVSLSGYNTTGYIAVNEGDKVNVSRKSGSRYIVRAYGFYDANKVWVSGESSYQSPTTYTIPAGVHYIKIAHDSSSEEYQIEIGEGVTSYVPYSEISYFDSALVDLEQEDIRDSISSINADIFTLDAEITEFSGLEAELKTNFYEYSDKVNLTFNEGTLYIGAGGTVSPLANTSYSYTDSVLFQKGDYLKVKASGYSNTAVLSKWTETGDFIETLIVGDGVTTEYIYTVTDEVEYLRLCTQKDIVPTTEAYIGVGKWADLSNLNIEAYDQSLNTTDDVKFSSVTTDVLKTEGETKTGTLANPPTGLIKGDVWADTTDSDTHPILRVMI